MTRLLDHCFEDKTNICSWIDALYKNRANLTIKSSDNRNLLHNIKDLAVIQHLFDNCYDMAINMVNQRCESDKTPILEQLLGSDDPYYWRPTRYRPDDSTKYQHFEIAKLLIKHQANINVVGSYARSSVLGAIMQLPRCDKEDIAQLSNFVEHLFQHCEPDIEIRHSNGQTPLLIAAEFHHSYMIEYLIKRGANINAVDDKHWGILHQFTLLDGGYYYNSDQHSDDHPLQYVLEAYCDKLLE